MQALGKCMIELSSLQNISLNFNWYLLLTEEDLSYFVKKAENKGIMALRLDFKRQPPFTEP